MSGQLRGAGAERPGGKEEEKEVRREAGGGRCRRKRRGAGCKAGGFGGGARQRARGRGRGGRGARELRAGRGRGWSCSRLRPGVSRLRSSARPHLPLLAFISAPALLAGREGALLPFPWGTLSGPLRGCPSRRGPGAGGSRLGVPGSLGWRWGLARSPQRRPPDPREKPGFPLLQSRSGGLVPERVCLRRPKMAFKVYF